KTTSVVGLVTATSMPITVPNTVISANWFKTTNQGRKVIVDTLGVYAQPPSAQPGPASQPAKIVLRCTSAPSPCANYAANKGQVQPPTVTTSSTAASQTNFIYDARAIGLLKGSAGAAINRGTSRNLPGSTP